jgi:hypothetical protein
METNDHEIFKAACVTFNAYVDRIIQKDNAIESLWRNFNQIRQFDLKIKVATKIQAIERKLV